MSEQLLEIDITKRRDENGDEDFLDIRVSQEKHFKVNFSKLVSQSKYIRDKYKYSEASSILSEEISQLQRTTKIKEKSVEHFLKIIQTGKVIIKYEEYQDMYKLSKYFELTRLTHELDEIFNYKMCKDLNFSIETLLYSVSEEEEIESCFLSKIETFVSIIFNCHFYKKKTNFWMYFIKIKINFTIIY